MRLKTPGLIDFAAILFAVGIFNTPTLTGDPGVGWHLKTGEWILQNFTVPHADPFVFSGERVWHANQWLSDVLFWKIFQIGSWPMLHAVLPLFVLSAFLYVLLTRIQKITSSHILTLFTFILVLMVGRIQWIVRPVILSFLFFSLSFTIINSYLEKPSKKIFYLPLLFIIWANCHPAFPLGFLVLGAAGAYTLFQLKDISRTVTLAVVMLLCFLATLLNPYGIELYSSIFSLVNSDYFMKLNVEWYSPDFSLRYFWPMLAHAVVVGLLILRVNKKTLNLFDWLCLLGFLILSLNQRRYIPFYAIASSVSLAKLLREYASCIGPLPTVMQEAADNIERKLSFASRGGYCFTLLALVLASVYFSGALPFKDYDHSTPKNFLPTRAIEYLSKQDLDSADRHQIFHSPDTGGYITFKLWPRAKAYIDDRNYLNTEARYKEFFLMRDVKSGWQEIFDGYRFDWVLLEPNRPLISKLRNEENWEVAYEDDSIVLLKRVT